jgi:hypothetical protein
MAAQREIKAELATNNKGAGQFTLASRGRTWAEAMGEGDKLANSQKNILALYDGEHMRSWGGSAKEGNVDVLITYAVDGLDKNPRSGDAVLVYIYVQHITGTKNGKPIEITEKPSSGTVKIHDDNLINREFTP